MIHPIRKSIGSNIQIDSEYIFNLLWIVFESLHNVLASQLEALVTRAKHLIT